MTWYDTWLDRLSTPEYWGYTPNAPPAAEPLALIALALAAHNRTEAAQRTAAELVGLQNPDGSVGIMQGEADPGWPTAWAVLAWTAVAATTTSPHADPIRKAIDWIISVEGTKIEQNTELVAHNTTLVGWPWVTGTHSWIEPTAACVLALRSQGLGGHPRAKEAVRLLFDRLLPAGGCNYGNTAVLGQILRPHLEPSGLVLLALAGQGDPEGRLLRTLGYVRRNVGPNTTAASLSYGLLGLAAHGEEIPAASAWLEAATERTSRIGAMIPRVTLCTLAAVSGPNPLVRIARGELQATRTSP